MGHDGPIPMEQPTDYYEILLNRQIQQYENFMYQIEDENEKRYYAGRVDALKAALKDYKELREEKLEEQNGRSNI